MNSNSCMVWKYFVRYREVGTNYGQLNLQEVAAVYVILV